MAEAEAEAEAEAYFQIVIPRMGVLSFHYRLLARRGCSKIALPSVGYWQRDLGLVHPGRLVPSYCCEFCPPSQFSSLAFLKGWSHLRHAEDVCASKTNTHAFRQWLC